MSVSLGIESTKAGPDLFEFAELLVLLGAQEVRVVGQSEGIECLCLGLLELTRPVLLHLISYYCSLLWALLQVLSV